MHQKWALIICWMLTICSLCIKSAHSIPAFARREHVQCQMCHFRMPELNQDGQNYALRGLREEPEMSMPAKTEAPLGVPLNIDWAKYLTVMGHEDFIAATGQRPEFDAGTIDIWAAGPITNQWTGLANPSFDVENGGSGVDQAYGQFINKWSWRFDSGRFGQLQPFAILFNQGGPSMTLSTPLVLSTPTDTGSGWTPTTLLRGIEAGIVNTSRWNVYIGAAQPQPDGNSDDPGFENHTNVYSSGEWLIGSNGNSVSIYGYLGNAWLSPTASDESFHRIGFFANFYTRDVLTKASAGFLIGSDDDEANQSLDNSGFFVLGEHLFTDRWAAYLRYDQFKQDLSAGGSQTTLGPTVGVSWWAATQIRLTLEGQFLKTTDEDWTNTFTAEFLWVF